MANHPGMHSRSSQLDSTNSDHDSACCRKANFLKNIVPWMADPKLPDEARDRWVEIWSRADGTLGTEVTSGLCL